VAGNPRQPRSRPLIRASPHPLGARPSVVAGLQTRAFNAVAPSPLGGILRSLGGRSGTCPDPVGNSAINAAPPHPLSFRPKQADLFFPFAPAKEPVLSGVEGSACAERNLLLKPPPSPPPSDPSGAASSGCPALRSGGSSDPCLQCCSAVPSGRHPPFFWGSEL
jgi:hypothetical protein